MAKVFSFCIYGEKIIYLDGMIRNIQEVQIFYPEFEIHIYAGLDVPEAYLEIYEQFKAVHLYRLPITGGRLTSHRFFAIDSASAEIMIVRDADSRITDRDRWCIDNFIASSFSIFSVRDHKNHTREIMGGLWGMKKIPGFSIRSAYNTFAKNYADLDCYQSDQDFLRNHVYRKYRKSVVIYSPRWAYPGENHIKITLHRKDAYDFCGNVILVDKKGEHAQYLSDDNLPEDMDRLIQLHENSPDGWHLP